MKKKAVKTPVLGKVAKVPVVIQLEALECGAACLCMVMAYYDKWIPLEEMRVSCGVSRDGSSAINIIRAARNYGMKAGGYRCEPEQIKIEGSFPCIIHWNFNHFVVLNGFKHGKVYITDPARGEYTVSMETFDECFTGVVLQFEPTENFVPSGEPKSVWKFAKKRLKNLKAPVAVAVMSTLIASLVSLVSPVFSRIFYDRLLSGRNPEWAVPFLMLLGGLYIIQIISAFISAYTNARVNGKMSVVGCLSYMWKVLHLPMHFFSQRMTGDIHSRQDGNARAAGTLVNTLSPLVLNFFMAVFYFIIMMRYSLELTVLGLVSAILNMLVSQYISRQRVNLTRVKSRETGKLASSTVSGIQMIETIKASGAEDGFFEKWAGHFATVNSITQKFTRENQTLMLLPSLLSSFVSCAMVGIGVYLTMKGSFTLGAITAFQGFFASFIAPVNEIIGAEQTIQEMRTDMERIDDVMEYPDDANVVSLEKDEIGGFYKLSGNIEIKNVTFSYSPLSEPVVKNLSLDIKQGSCVAFVGSSGSGKSTISKLISGIYSPIEGEILFDGKHVNEIDHRIFTGSLAVVDQDIVLFEDTVANNIKMWDDSIEDFAMILAAVDAQVHEDILAKEGGYQHKIAENGKDFSGGQRQRIEIARVLAQEPNIIILDEATSALDAVTEYNVIKAIKERGITCIVIAHRLSAVRDCDEIVVLEQGEAVERGTHGELMRLNGRYTRLITSE